MGMTYKKPQDVRYVDMCVYIDNCVKGWDPELNPFTVEQEENIYQYIYHLYYNIACRKHFFTKFSDFDEYALWCATRAFTRIIDKRQFTGELLPIKSILNYVKATAYGWKLKWQSETFQTIINTEYDKTFDPISFRQLLVNNIEHNNRERVIDSVLDDIKYIPKQLEDIINTLPYKDDKLLCHKLYLNCLIIFVSNLKQTMDMKNTIKSIHKVDSVQKLWHLDDEYINIVTYILNRLKDEIKDSLYSSMSKLNITEDEVVNLFWEQTTSSGTKEEDY